MFSTVFVINLFDFDGRASGEVFSAEIKGTGRIVAVKQMNIYAQQRLDLLINELKLVRELKHENIVNFIEGFLIDGQPEICQLWAVMELLQGGSLTAVVMETVLRDNQIAGVTRACVRALDYLHSKVGLYEYWSFGLLCMA